MNDSQNSSTSLALDSETRASLWKLVAATIETYLRTVDELPVSPTLDVTRVRSFAESFTFEQSFAPEEAFRLIAAELIQSQVHTPHPQYFGLFNPAPTAMSIAADALVATLNPQLAAWSHSPLAAEMERHLVISIADKFGLPRGQVDGVLTSGGAEANQTALLTALAQRWPEVTLCGLRGLKEEPVFYVSAEGHHSFLKAARAAGLGASSLREIEVTDDLCIDLDSLRAAIHRDHANGHAPFLLVATAGTTGAGAIDPLPNLASLAREHGLWFHVDAAWGGAAALVPELHSVLDGIELADSITFDAHKWLSVSMGAGMFLTRHPDILSRCFATQTAYMPKESEGMQVADPFAHSLQWSRRFIGLKLFLSLAVAGWDGYAAAIRHQTEMGELLRNRLIKDKWKIVNRTPLPLVCFTDGETEWDTNTCQRIANAVVASGQAWISTIQLGKQKQPALRACITNYQTKPHHIDALLDVLNHVRRPKR
ncbi:pyridoxal phosphate-dependent decarboxylase family protein [Tunturiibacter gelidiferens]|uniref:pyridoxal phosphate-dependent decarboxylase family protein n=1 Tax=Tunturiibacter gelidiferens TaxID=3069689 RepID=UPI003D9B0CA8